MKIMYKECYRDPTDNKSIINVMEIFGKTGKCKVCKKKTSLIIRSSKELFPTHNYQGYKILRWICGTKCILKYIDYEPKKVVKR